MHQLNGTKKVLFSLIVTVCCT